MAELTWKTKSGFSGPNPFVGPRPLQRGEALHGRDTEVRELFDLLKARRIAVLHSPAGAGKTSLVQAGLVPRLKESRFDVWAPIRVDLDPKKLEGAPPDVNRFLLSTMMSLEEELPAAHRRGAAELAKLDLLEYLDSRPRRKGRAGRSVVLLFEQLEQVLTVEPQADEAKREFFTEVGRALESEKYWALFIIREDHLAAFAPYRDRVPTQMSNTYRLDLLSPELAREVVTKLAERSGRSFPAADALVEELSAVHVQKPDGTVEVERGTHIEPAHLQLVGRRLWDAMPDDDLSIDEEDVALYAEVSDALGGYYADAVRSVARGDVVVERSIRDWIGRTLIVSGVRVKVQPQAKTNALLDERVIDELRSWHLVQAELRAGATWLELSRDRLVEPILSNNETWEKAHLHPLQLKAKRWEDGRRERDLLLEAKDLPEATEWAQANAEQITESEQQFLEQSVKVRAEVSRNLQARRVLERGAKVLGGVAVAAIVLGGIAWKLLSDDVDDAREDVESMRQQFEGEARRARNMHRVLAAYTLVHPPAGRSPDAERQLLMAATAFGLLAELEGDDVQHTMRGTLGQWPQFIEGAWHSAPSAMGEAIANLSDQEVRGVLWTTGRCPDQALRVARLGRSQQQAAVDEQRCKDMHECVGCSASLAAPDASDCFEPGGFAHGRLRAEITARLGTCQEEFRRSQAADEPFSPTVLAGG